MEHESIQMLVDTEKTNCSNCKLWLPYKVPEAVLNHPMMNPNNIGELKACNGKYGFGITGVTFYCTKHELKKDK